MNKFDPATSPENHKIKKRRERRAVGQIVSEAFNRLQEVPIDSPIKGKD